jgi:hypothetical protein
MSNKVILLSMVGILILGLLAVLLVIRSSVDEKTVTTFVRPVNESELVSKLLGIAKSREEAAGAVHERGVSLRPVRDYAERVAVREADRISQLETLPNNGAENVGPVDWWGLPETELAERYVTFELEQNQLLKQALLEYRLFKNETNRDLALGWSGETVGDEAKLQELYKLLPAK